MSFLKKIIVICLILNQSIGAMGTKPYLEPYKVYYDVQNLKTIDTQGQQRHAAMEIYIDEQDEINPESTSTALTEIISLSLPKKSFPILASAHLIKNILIRSRTYDAAHFHSKDAASKDIKESFDKAQFVASEWDIYDVPQTQFILLIPKAFTKLYEDNNLGIKKLPSLANLLPAIPDKKTESSYQGLIDWLEKNKSIIPFSSKNLNEIFINKKDETTPIWDFFIMGHGGFGVPEPAIANLKPAVFNSLLSFFDNEIKTGIIYVVSCFAGGQNRTLLETTKEGVQINHNFIFILGAIGDKPVNTVTEKLDKEIHTFFNNAGFIQDKGTGLNNLLRYLSGFKITSSSSHGASGLPQIWLPGGYGFQTFNVLNHFLTIGNVYLKKQKEDKKDIWIENTLAILLYPAFIDVALHIYPAYLGAFVPKSFKDLTFIYEPQFFENINPQKQKEIIEQLKLENVLPRHFEGLPEQAKAADFSNPNQYLYPQFISMKKGKSGAAFSKITVKRESGAKDNIPRTQGVLQFIRDAFFDPNQEGHVNYYIDELIGVNDISLTLAALDLYLK